MVRREFWEHRALFWAPLIVAALFVSMAVFSVFLDGSVSISIDGEDANFFALLEADPVIRGQLFAVWMGALALPQFGLGLILVFFYLLDCLYAERRDRSILFWKSMPVSDASTVISKLAVAMLAVPAWIWMLTMVSGLVIFAALSTQLSGTPIQALATFSITEWFALQGFILGDLLVAALWFAPVIAYLLVVSAFAKRGPFLWATLPPLALAVAERTLLGTSYLGQFFIERLTGYFSVFSTFNTRTSDPELLGATIAEAYGGLNALPLLAEASTWVGVLLAAPLLVLAIRIRRWRDDAL
jgi:ABC-2 type transport system permease protein